MSCAPSFNVAVNAVRNFLCESRFLLLGFTRTKLYDDVRHSELPFLLISSRVPRRQTNARLGWLNE